MEEDRSKWLLDPVRQELEKRAFVLFLIFSTFSMAFFEGPRAWGIVAGSAISFMSFRSLRKTLERGFGFIITGQHGAGAFIAMRYYLKLAVIFLLMAYLLKERKIEAIGLAAGLLVVPLAMIYTGIKMHLINRGGKTE